MDNSLSLPDDDGLEDRQSPAGTVVLGTDAKFSKQFCGVVKVFGKPDFLDASASVTNTSVPTADVAGSWFLEVVVKVLLVALDVVLCLALKLMTDTIFCLYFTTDSVSHPRASLECTKNNQLIYRAHLAFAKKFIALSNWVPIKEYNIGC